MGGTGTHKRAPRGNVIGWSAASARRLTQKLYQVHAPSLNGYGYAVTLTMRDTPPDSETFHRLRAAWLKRLARMGVDRVQWVIEWQRRGTPHIHAAVYAPNELSVGERNMLVAHWVLVAGEYGVELGSQDVNDISGPIGWLKYLSKHAARGANHYQRSGNPTGWEKTGRLWGFVGDWPLVEPVVFDHLSNDEFYRLRRVCRAWARADAAKNQDWKRLAYLRRAGRPNNAYESRFRGISEWISSDDMLRLVEYWQREARTNLP